MDAGTIAIEVVGGPLGGLLDDRVQAVLFAAVALVAAWRLLKPQPEGPADHIAPPRRGRPLLIALAAGFAIGMLTSVLGVGGAFLPVPALVLVAKTPSP